MTYERVSEYLKNLDNFYIIVDNDPDGVCSGILMKTILHKLNKKYKVVIKKKRSYRRLEESLLDFNNYQNFVFLDTPFPDEDLIKIAREYPKNTFIYIDHHKYKVPDELPSNLIYFDIRAKNYEIKSVSAAVYKLGKIIFGDEFKKYSLIALAGSMCDWITDDETLNDFKKYYKGVYTDDYNNITHPISLILDIFKYVDFSYLLNNGENLIENPHEFLKKLKINKMLDKYKKLLEEVVSSKIIYKSKSVIVFKVNSKASEAAGILATFYPDKITVVISPIKDTFVEKILPKKYKVSIRSREETVHLGKILEEFTKKYGINGGGHPKAAGGAIWKKDLDKLLEFIEKSVESEALH